MAAMVYNDLVLQRTDEDAPKTFLICPKAMVFVSDQPAFKVLSQVLELIYARVVIPGINDLLMGA